MIRTLAHYSVRTAALEASKRFYMEILGDGAGITSIDWEHHPIASFADTPAIHVQIIARPDEPSLGVGEAAAGPTAAAIANAVAHALGIRPRHLPQVEGARAVLRCDCSSGPRMRSNSPRTESAVSPWPGP